MKPGLNNNTSGRALLLIAILMTPCMLVAHPAHGEIRTLSDGVLHFISGWDHLLTAALAGFMIASRKHIWSLSSLMGAISLPFVMFFLHQWQNGSSMWPASIGICLMAVILMACSCLSLKMLKTAGLSRGYRLRSGIGFALLALSLLLF